MHCEKISKRIAGVIHLLYICSKTIIGICQTINKNVMLYRLNAALAEQDSE